MSSIRIEYDHRIESPRSKKVKGHWAKRKRQGDIDKQALRDAAGNIPQMNIKAVRFTRIAPRPLDADNLAYSFKATQDELVRLLGLPDDSPRVGVDWIYRNEKELGEYRVRIEVME